MDISSYFDGVTFKENDHTYFFEGRRIERTASQMYKMFIEEFDTDFMATVVARKRKVAKDDVIKEWNRTRDESCDLGTRVHLFGENYAKDRSMIPTDGYEEAITKFWSKVPKHVEIAGLETVMYHKELKYAGTADIILYNREKDRYIVCDYKSNGNIYKNYKGKRMKAPFNNLLDMPYNHYQLQLSLYQMLVEQIDGVKVSIRRIIWLMPDGTFKIMDTEDYTEILYNELKRIL